MEGASEEDLVDLAEEVVVVDLVGEDLVEEDLVAAVSSSVDAAAAAPIEAAAA